MKITFVGRNIDVTEGLKSYTKDRLERFENYFSCEERAHVVMSVQKSKHKAEITISGNGIVIRAEQVSDDMYATIDLVVGKLSSQLRKYKSKIHDRENRSIKYELADNESFDLEDADDFSVVKRKVVNAKPMTEEEAILQLELLNHDFFVYRDMSNLTCVVYKRREGGYGVIESQ